MKKVRGLYFILSQINKTREFSVKDYNINIYNENQCAKIGH